MSDKKKSSGEAGVIATATVYQDETTVRGKIPASVVRALKANAGDVLVFERTGGGGVILRKSKAAERKGRAGDSKKKGGK